jgi:hypothetical protein
MKPYLSALLAALLFSSALSAQAEKVALIKVSHCSLAASAPIHKQLLEALSPKARGKISRLLAYHLAKTDPGELPGHFEKAVSCRP